MATGTARILSATISRTAQRWFVSFAVEVERAVPERHARPGSATGVDLGIKTLLTGVDDPGRVIAIPGPKPLRVACGGSARPAGRTPVRQRAPRTAASPPPGWPAYTPA